MNKKRVLIGMTAAALSLSMLAGCGKEETEETQTYTVNLSQSSMITKATDITLKRDGMILSDLTGEWIDESFENKRPIAVMINNLKPAMPQAGIGQADIVYEMLVEGGITRLMAIFTDYSNLDKIGPVRSARHYYDRKAMEYDAIYCHVGQSIFAEADFTAYPDLDNLNGLYAVGNVMYYRTSDRKAPHNCYTSSEGIDKGIEFEGYSTEKKASYDKMFQFNSEVQDIGGTPANKVTTAFNSGRQPWFEYNAEDGKYYRFQYGAPQIDELTGKQLCFENIIIQFAGHAPLEADLIDISLIGEDEGYYISNGQVIPIRWRKSSDNSVTHFYNIDGTELKMNPGKTWITLFPNNQKDGIIIE